MKSRILLPLGLVVAVVVAGTVMFFWAMDARLKVPAANEDSSLTTSENEQADQVASTLRGAPIFRRAVRSVAYSRDGKWLAIGAGDGQVRLWSVEQHKIVHTVAAHSNWSFDLTFAPDGTLFSGGGDNAIVLIDPSKGSILDQFHDHTNDLHGVAITPDGKWLISGGDDTRVVARSLEDETARELGRHTRQVTSVTVSPDGKLAASSSRDGTVILWNLETMSNERTLIGHSADVMTAAFAPDGHTVATAGYDRSVRIWDVATGETVIAFEGFDDWLFSVLYSQDSKFLFTGCGDCKLRIHNANNGHVVEQFDLGSDVADLALSPDGSTLAAGLSDGDVRLVLFEAGRSRLLDDEITIVARSPSSSTENPSDLASYLNLHSRILSHGNDWSDIVAMMSEKGDAFTLSVLRMIDKESLAADEEELLRRTIVRIMIRRGNSPEDLRPNEVAPIMFRTAFSDLMCTPLEGVIRRWLINTLTRQKTDSAIAIELNLLKTNPRIPDGFDKLTWGSASQRIKTYVDEVLRDQPTEEAK